MSCAGTPSWSRGRGQGVRSRGRRHHDRIRFVAAFLTAAEVTGTLTCRSRCAVCAPAPGRRGERCLAAAHARPEDTLRHTVCATGTSRSVRRDAIQCDALLARPDVERRSDDHGLRHRAARAPVTDVDARRAGPTADDRRHGRQPGRADRLPFPRRRRERRGNRTAADTRRGRTVSLHHACSDMFRFGKGQFCESNTGNFYVSNCHVVCLNIKKTSRTLTFEQCLIQLSVFIYILSVSCVRF